MTNVELRRELYREPRRFVHRDFDKVRDEVHDKAWRIPDAGPVLRSSKSAGGCQRPDGSPQYDKMSPAQRVLPGDLNPAISVYSVSNRFCPRKMRLTSPLSGESRNSGIEMLKSTVQ